MIQRLFLLLFLGFGMIQSANGQSPCSAAGPYTIVVIGSSTAAGSGPSPVDSAWVWRYRTYMQSLNPANQVINIARGGYTTYQMMPTGFTPPAGRPAPDTARNITKALSLNPDAIIINFPSNDVSNGFSVAEQLYNDSTVLAIAAAAGVPVWISTTQPKNYGSQVSIQKQMDVRDSLIARYSPYVLDFWTTIATPQGTIDSIYDSGDGTHLNNAAHYILFSRVRAAGIPDSLYVQPNFVDHSPLDIGITAASACGDSLTEIKVAVANLGRDNFAGLPVKLDFIETLSSASGSQTLMLPGGQASCTVDTVIFYVNTSGGGNFVFSAYPDAGAEGDRSNDTLTLTASYSGFPSVAVVGDTGCSALPLDLSASSNGGDLLRWYDSDTAASHIATGSVFQTPLLNQTTTYWVEAVRGDLFYRNSLLSTPSSNINWNGNMFNVIANTDVVLDSFSIRIQSTGSQGVKCYYRNGPYQGNEQNSGAWTYWGEDTVNVTQAGEFYTLRYDSLQVSTGDTVGFYFHMSNAGATLRYQRANTAVSVNNPEIDLDLGSGIAYTFGQIYFPRVLNVEVFYHYGSRPNGECQSGRVPVQALISNPSVSLGRDTILNTSAIYTLDAGAGHATYAWSTGDTTQTLQLDGSQLGTGIYHISVLVTDSAGCTASDTVTIVFAPLVSVQNPSPDGFRVWPNPVRNQLSWKWEAFSPGAELVLFDLAGKEHKRVKLAGSTGNLDVGELKPGVWLGRIETEGGNAGSFRIVKM